jgi:hypothetical protein
MLIVLPFCRKDAEDMEKLILWMLELDRGAPYDCLLSYDDDTPLGWVDRVEAAAKRFFKSVARFSYCQPPVPGWPAAPNWAWQSVARFMYERQPREPWFWIESDAIPIKSGWLTTIVSEFLGSGKDFGGHVVETMGHMNGVGIYPWNVMARSDRAMLTRGAAWDYVLKDAETGCIVELNHLMQHAWNVRHDGLVWNGDGRPISFRSRDDLVRYLDFNCYLFHRCKDGSLIDQLKAWKEDQRQKDIDTEKEKVISVEVNVPNFTENAVEFVPDLDFNGRTEIFIVTYRNDAAWLEYCLRAIRKFCTGFAGITVAYPETDFQFFKKMRTKYNINPHMYDEVRGRGMIQHMAMMAMADKIVPKGTEFVFHLDSDCIYKIQTTPSHYFHEGKPVMLKRSYESLVDGKGVVSDCAQWRGPTSAQIGFDPVWYTMCRHPNVFPIGFYQPYREHIEKVQNMGFMMYMLGGKNSFPQDRMDWTAMGAWAHKFMFDSFHWIDIGKDAPPADRQKTYWSHSGILPEHKEEMEGFLNTYVPTAEETERMAQ